MAVGILGVGIYYSAGSEATQPLPEEEIVDTIQTQYPGKVTNVNLEQDEGAPHMKRNLLGKTKSLLCNWMLHQGKCWTKKKQRNFLMMRKPMTHYKQQIQTTKMQIKQNRLTNHPIKKKRSKIRKKNRKINPRIKSSRKKPIQIKVKKKMTTLLTK